MIKFARLIPAIVVAAALVPVSALAYDGQISGTLKYVHVKGNSAADSLMLELSSSVSLCGSGKPAQTYLSSSSYAYQAMVSTANAAFLAGRTVTLYSDWFETNSVTHEGYCVLKQIRMQ